MKTFQHRFFGYALFIAALSSPVFGSNISWTTWGAQPTPTSATGTLLVGVTPVSVTYNGEIAFTQLNGSGNNYFQPTSTFTALPTVPNAPPSDLIAIDGTATTHTVTFGAPVVNPIMDVVSLGGGASTQYIFSLAPNQSLAILGQGPSSAFGGCATCLSLSGTTLTGTEGDGVIQFTGTFSSLTWTGANPENWNGFTFGVTGLAGPTSAPEPGTWGTMLLAGMIGIPAVLRRARK